MDDGDWFDGAPLVAFDVSTVGFESAWRRASITSGMTASMSDSGSANRSLPSSATLISASVN